MKMKCAPSRNKPFEVKRGNVTVKICNGANRVGGKVYPQFTLVCYHAGERKKHRFADIGHAKREAELVATKLANGDTRCSS